MAALTVAYATAWIAVVLYVAWLTVENKRLAQRVDDFTASPRSESKSRFYSRAG